MPHSPCPRRRSGGSRRRRRPAPPLHPAPARIRQAPARGRFTSNQRRSPASPCAFGTGRSHRTDPTTPHDARQRSDNRREPAPRAARNVRGVPEQTVPSPPLHHPRLPAARPADRPQERDGLVKRGLAIRPVHPQLCNLLRRIASSRRFPHMTEIPVQRPGVFFRQGSKEA